MPQQIFGPIVTDGGTQFRLWAPNLSTAPALVLPDHSPVPMREVDGGFYELVKADVEPGQHYMYDIAGTKVPDPASRLQADDAAGWSVVQGAPLSRPARSNRRPDWTAAVICELHVGTVTPEGSFAALAAKLPYFAEAGYNVIELMPVADFAGKRGWGYDGVLPFAPDRAYGSPEDLRYLIDRAHELGLGIMLDVVYNHFGPSGNFLHLYAERFFSNKETTPWGSAINLEDPTVRAFFVENACMWVEDYGFDGLRFDAVHAFMKGGGDVLLREIASAVRQIDPEAYLVLENDDNSARWLERDDGLTPEFYSAQWNDDFHHILHLIASGEIDGYYRDYSTDPIAVAARTLTEGFVYQGEASAHRDGLKRGEVSRHLHPSAFVSFTQNHDQIGNRAFGDRLITLASDDVNRVIRFTFLLSPQIPMLFMGEEFGSITPFLYFCDFDGELAEAIRNGRKKEFAAFTKFGETTADIPDPLSEDTFLRSKLDWAALKTREGVAYYERFRTLTALRQQVVVPLLKTRFSGATSVREATSLLCRWTFDGGSYGLAVNFGEQTSVIEAPDIGAFEAWEGDIETVSGKVRFGPWSAALWRHS